MSGSAAIVKELEQQRHAAMLAGDVERLAVLLADDLHYMHSNAIADDKPSYLGKIADGSLNYLSLEVTEQVIKDLGDCAAVHGRLEGDIVSNGQPRRLNARFIGLWRRGPEGWLFKAFAPTPIT